MLYQTVLFDLDGTLTDPGVGITNSIMYALEKYGITVSDRSELYKFIGPPLWESFEKFYGFSKEEANQAVGLYREYYRVTGIYENSLYDGIDALLQDLLKNGRRLLLATSKPEIFARQVLEHFNLTPYFEHIAGSELDGTRVHKDEVIRYALEKGRIAELNSAVMVGDREHDIIGAKKTGLRSIGILYGYGSRAELEAAGADEIADTTGALRSLLLR